jgi:hypothetical protein
MLDVKPLVPDAGMEQMAMPHDHAGRK